jgi:hypothetical protein
MATLTTLTPRIAQEIAPYGRFHLDQFIKEGDANDYIMFTHRNFFYSYPDWGKQWPDGKDCEYHRVDTKCHLCGHIPDRNFAGYGTLYLLNNGVSDEDILVVDEWQIKRGKRVPVTKRVPNTPRLSPMILHCKDCIKSYFEWKSPPKIYLAPKPVPIKATTQLALF